MLGRSVSIFLLCFVSVLVCAPALAQKHSSTPRRPTLSERLQRFRNDLLGSPEAEPTPAPQRVSSAPGSSIRKPVSGQPTLAQPQVPPAVVEDLDASEAHQPALANSAEMPPQLEVQSARRARGNSAPVTVFTPNRSDSTAHTITPTPATGASKRNPVEEARRRTFAEPTEPIDSDYETTDESVSDNYVEETLPDDDYDNQLPQAPSSNEAPYDEAPVSDDPYEVSSEEVVPNAEARRSFAEHNKLRAEPMPTIAPVDATPTTIESQPQPIVEYESSSVPVMSDDSNVLFVSQSPVIAVEASGPRTVMIGKEAEFFVRIRNSGSAANNVVVKVVIPNDAAVAGCRSSAGMAQAPTQHEITPGLEWTLDRLEAHSEETLTLKLIPRKSAPLDLAISYTFAPETTQTLVEVQEPKLAMSLSGPSEVLFGQTKIYKLTVSNPGNGDTHGVNVGLLPIGQSSEAQATHGLGTLVAGESKTIDIELTARQAGAIQIKAQSFADGGLRAEATTEVRVRRAELQVMVDAPHVKYAGTPTTYTLTVSNVGDAFAEHVQLSAILPEEAKFLAASGGRLDPQQARVSWTVGSLPAGAQRVFELHCTLYTPGENQLQATAQGSGELLATAISATQVEAIADLKLEVRDPQGPVAVGADTVYEIRIRNRGTKAAEAIDLAAFFSEGLEPSAADGGEHEIGPGQVIFQPIAAIEAGEQIVFRVKARAQQAGNHVFRAELNCESLGTRLAAEEATHFYGDSRVAGRRGRGPTLAQEPTLAVPRDAQPIEAASAPRNTLK